MPLTIVQPGVGGTGSSTTSSTGTGAAVLATQPSFPSTIGVGGATASSSGAGITFPATQSASTDANTLDDYEEGTFTPSLGSGFSSAPTGYTYRIGSYTKIGRFVYFQIDIDPDGAVANSTTVSISGLPFTTTSAGNGYGASVVSYQVSFNTNGSDIYHIGASNTTIEIYQNTGSGRLGNSAGVNINSRFIIVGFYQV